MPPPEPHQLAVSRAISRAWTGHRAPAGALTMSAAPLRCWRRYVPLRHLARVCTCARSLYAHLPVCVSPPRPPCGRGAPAVARRLTRSHARVVLSQRRRRQRVFLSFSQAVPTSSDAGRFVEAFFGPSDSCGSHAWHFGRLAKVTRSGASVLLTVEWLVEGDGSSVVPVPVSEFGAPVSERRVHLLGRTPPARTAPLRVAV